jgi:predicted metalloprotease with PDZ domain
MRMRVSAISVRILCAAVMATPLVAQQPPGIRPGSVIDSAAAMDIVVKPVRNGSADVQYAEIRQHVVRSPGVTIENLTVLVPGGPPGANAVAGLETLEMTDRHGPVPVRNDSGGTRRWRAERTVTFPVSLTYRARMWPPGTRTNPSYMLRASGGAVSGQGTGMFITLSDGVEYPARFRWDLSDMAPGAITTSGLTDDNDVRAPFPSLLRTFFMAGQLQRYPEKGDRDGFVAFWHGTPPWDGPRVMDWVASMYEYMRSFHGETQPRRYRVMGRMLPPPAYGGTALPNHFIFNAPAGPRDTTDAGPLLLLAHEAGHLFVRGLQNPGGGGPSNNWFTEGLNEYYAVVLALRSGLAPLDVVLDQINHQTRNYYTNSRRNMPADSIAMFNPMTDGRAQNASYERGLLFWADMDARIRAASKGRRNLDSVILPLIARAREAGDLGAEWQARPGGQRGWFTPAELVDSLEKAGGAIARQMFDSVIVRGKTIVPASNAFGPCFELRPAKLHGAYRALAADRARPIDPSIPDIDGYAWVRVASVPDERCRAW